MEIVLLTELRNEIVNRLGSSTDVQLFIEYRQEFSDGVRVLFEGGRNGFVCGSFRQHREELQIDRRKDRWKNRWSIQGRVLHPREDVGCFFGPQEGSPRGDRLYRAEEVFGPDIFGQIPVPAGHNGVIEVAIVAVGREEQDPHTGKSRYNVAAGIGSSAIGQAHVHNDYIRLGAMDFFNGAGPAASLANHINATIQFEDGSESLMREG